LGQGVIVIIDIKMSTQLKLSEIVEARDAVRFGLAFESAGNRRPARIAMIAMTTSNSINVKP